MNRLEIIKALNSANLKKIRELKKAEKISRKGRFIGFADLNLLNDQKGIKSDSWSIPLLGLQQIGGKWIQSGKFSNLSHESFASLIVENDYQVMAEGYYLNYKFPEESEYYDPPDPTLTPEKKYMMILAEIKEIAEICQKEHEKAMAERQQKQP